MPYVGKTSILINYLMVSYVWTQNQSFATPSTFHVVFLQFDFSESQKVDILYCIYYTCKFSLPPLVGSASLCWVTIWGSQSSVVWSEDLQPFAQLECQRGAVLFWDQGWGEHLRSQDEGGFQKQVRGAWLSRLWQVPLCLADASEQSTGICRPHNSDCWKDSKERIPTLVKSRSTSM